MSEQDPYANKKKNETGEGINESANRGNVENPEPQPSPTGTSKVTFKGTAGGENKQE